MFDKLEREKQELAFELKTIETEIALDSERDKNEELLRVITSLKAQNKDLKRENKELEQSIGERIKKATEPQQSKLANEATHLLKEVVSAFLNFCFVKNSGFYSNFGQII